MKILLTLLALLLATPAQAIILVGFGGGSSCATQSQDQAFDAAGSNATSGFYVGGSDHNVVGQSFKPGVSGSLYSVAVMVGNSDNSSNTLSLRFGNSSDLTSYTFEISGQAIGVIYDTYVEFIIPSGSRPTLTAGTTYYFNIQSPVNQIYLEGQTTSGYAAGTFYSGTTGWNANTDMTRDVNFKTKMCN